MRWVGARSLLRALARSGLALRANNEPPKEAEDHILAAFCNGVSDRSRSELLDPNHPFPFANLDGRKGLARGMG
jgi:hypothetical protein